MEYKLEWLLLFLYFNFPFPFFHSKWEAGMNMSPVSRLKKTWAKVKTAKFDILEVCEADILLLSNILHLKSGIFLCDLAS